MKKLLFSSWMLLTIAFGACNKESEPEVIPPEEIKPGVKLLSPTLFQHYHHGAEIIISGKAIAGSLLHGYHLMVFDKNTGDTLFQDDGHTHAKEFTFSDTMVHNLNTDYEARAYVQVFVDHDHNFVADSVDFYLLAQ